MVIRLTLFSLEPSDGIMRPQDVRCHGFLEVGAAAFLVGYMEATTKDHSRMFTGSQDLPDIDQLLQPSTATVVSNHATSHGHLKAIACSKRLKPDAQQIWFVFSNLFCHLFPLIFFLVFKRFYVRKQIVLST